MHELRKLRVFLCYSSQDRQIVYRLYERLLKDDWIDPWLDEKALLPGEDRELKIEETLKSTDVALICLSKQSLGQEDYFQREIELVANFAKLRPEGSMSIIPIRLDECEIPPLLHSNQYVDFFKLDGERENAYLHIRRSMKTKFQAVSGETAETHSAHWVSTEKRKLKIFLCYASQDKSIVSELYQQLIVENWIEPWLDEQELYPGQDWHFEIEKAVRDTDSVIACLSSNSVNKEGYIQRELRFVLNVADEKPEGSIFVIPLRLDECVVPTRLRTWQYVDYFPKERKAWAYKRLLGALKIRHNSIK